MRLMKTIGLPALAALALGIGIAPASATIVNGTYSFTVSG